MQAPPHGPIRRIPLRRLVAAAFLHFGVLAYLVAVPVLCLLLAPGGAGPAQLLALGIRVSGWFLAASLATALVAIAVAAGIDAHAGRRERRLEASDAAISRRRMSRACRLAADDLGSGAQPIATRIAARPWRHDDARYQALSRDLAQLVDTAAAALAQASPDQAGAIRERTIAALNPIDRALADLAEEHATLADGEARAAALYVERRYGAPDFTIQPD